MNIEIGGMCPTISEQLKSAGIKLGGGAELLDQLRDALLLLYIKGVITPAQFESVGKRIAKKVERAIKDQSNQRLSKL